MGVTKLTGRLARRIGAAAFVCFALGMGAAIITGRSVLDDPRWIVAMRSEVEQTTGLRFQFESAPVVQLLPRPRLVARDVGIAESGTLAVHASAVEGTVALLPLLRGQVVLDRVRLDDVTGAVDADAILRAFREPVDDATGDSEKKGVLPERVTVSSGFLQVRSSMPGANGFLSGIHAVADGIQAGPATLSGGATWHGEKGEFSARVDSLARFLKSGPATGTVKLKSPSLTAAAAGTWARGWRGAFAGSVTAASPDFPTLLRIAGAVPGPLAGVHSVSFSATAEPGVNGLGFSAARVVVNGNELEGTLGFQVADGHPIVVGTLATDQLDLDPILATLPAFRDKTGAWNAEAAPFNLGDLHDLDLRISAGKIRLNGLVAEDAALSALSRDGRMELSLGEARAYGGLLKARLLSSGAVDGVSVKLDASWSQLDLAGLGDAAGLEQGRLTGTSSGHATFEGEGSTIANMVSSLDGKGQVSLLQVEAKTPTLGALMHPTDAVPDLSGKVAFDLATLDFHVARGTLDLDKGTISGPDLHLDLTGRASLSDRSYVLSTQPSDGEAPTDKAPTTSLLRIAGVWGGPVHWTTPDAPDSGSPASRPSELGLMP